MSSSGIEVKKQDNETPVNQLALSQPVKQSQNKEQAESNQLHKNKRRKRKHHRKPKIIRDPQEIKEIRMQRLNVKREVHWNNRFINDTIPNLYQSKRKKRQSEALRKGKSPLHATYIERQTKNRLPNITDKDKKKQTITKSTNKSFKIRHLKRQSEKGEAKNGKQSQKEETQPKQEKQKNNDLIETINEEIKKTNKKTHNKQILLSKFLEKIKIYPVSQPYKELMEDLINRATDKKYRLVRKAIEHQIDTIGTEKHSYSHIAKLIEQRRSLLKSITETAENTTLKAYLDLQITSLMLIEQILKFKAKWEQIYYNVFEINKKINYIYEGSNYLLTMKEEVLKLSQSAPDPFLISKTFKLQQLVGLAQKEQQLIERKEMMLKIRACELLLIEQQLIVGK